MFYDLDKLEYKNIFDGVKARLAYGEKIMMSFVNIEPGIVIPEHSHPHEQMGMLLEGEAEFIIGGEKKLVKQGEAYLIPSNVKHQVTTFKKPVLALDIFSPIREDYISL